MRILIQIRIYVCMYNIYKKNDDKKSCTAQNFKFIVYFKCNVYEMLPLSAVKQSGKKNVPIILLTSRKWLYGVHTIGYQKTFYPKN